MVRSGKPAGYERPLDQLVGSAAVLVTFGAAVFGFGVALVVDSEPFNPGGGALLLPGTFFFLAGVWLAKIAWQDWRAG